jgi:rhodanese-related sulfurtransferase
MNKVYQPSRRLCVLSLCGAVVGCLTACGPQTPEATGAKPNNPLRVELAEARELLSQQKALVFDIREPSEHATGFAAGALLLPMSQLDKRVGEIPKDPAQPVLIICNTQNRSSKVVQALVEAGWTNVRYVHGGMSTWAANGWPMVKPF